MHASNIDKATAIIKRTAWLKERIEDLKSPHELQINWGNRSIAIDKLDLSNEAIRQHVIKVLERELQLQQIRANDIGLII